MVDLALSGIPCASPGRDWIRWLGGVDLLYYGNPTRIHTMVIPIIAAQLASPAHRVS